MLFSFIKIHIWSSCICWSHNCIYCVAIFIKLLLIGRLYIVNCTIVATCGMVDHWTIGIQLLCMLLMKLVYRWERLMSHAALLYVFCVTWISKYLKNSLEGTTYKTVDWSSFKVEVMVMTSKPHSQPISSSITILQNHL